jgi:hypothetical protein
MFPPYSPKDIKSGLYEYKDASDETDTGNLRFFYYKGEFDGFNLTIYACDGSKRTDVKCGSALICGSRLIENPRATMNQLEKKANNLLNLSKWISNITSAQSQPMYTESVPEGYSLEAIPDGFSDQGSLVLVRKSKRE